MPSYRTSLASLARLLLLFPVSTSSCQSTTHPRRPTTNLASLMCSFWPPGTLTSPAHVVFFPPIRPIYPFVTMPLHCLPSRALASPSHLAPARPSMVLHAHLAHPRSSISSGPRLLVLLVSSVCRSASLAHPLFCLAYSACWLLCSSCHLVCLASLPACIVVHVHVSLVLSACFAHLRPFGVYLARFVCPHCPSSVAYLIHLTSPAVSLYLHMLYISLAC